jgi:hypothetical protein
MSTENRPLSPDIPDLMVQANVTAAAVRTAVGRRARKRVRQPSLSAVRRRASDTKSGMHRSAGSTFPGPHKNQNANGP